MKLQEIIDKRNKYGKGVNLIHIFTIEELKFLKEEIVKINQSGVSFVKISKQLNIERPAIRKWMKSINYKITNEHNKLKVREDLFREIKTEEDAYWLGFIYADGYISDKGNFEISLKHTDYEHLLKFAEYCKFDKNKVVSKGKTNFLNSFRCRISFSAQQTQINFNKHGVVPRKSLILTFPTFLKESLYPHFIRGYFDGDGCISIIKLKKLNRKKVSLIGTKEFLNKILEILTIKVNLSKDKRHNGNTYWIDFNKKDGNAFLDYMYENSKVYLERKYNLYLQ